MRKLLAVTALASALLAGCGSTPMSSDQAGASVEDRNATSTVQTPPVQTVTPGADARTDRASSSPIGRPNVRLIDSLCARSTGTRIHVAVIARSGAPKIFRVSLIIFTSSTL